MLSEEVSKPPRDVTCRELKEPLDARLARPFPDELALRALSEEQLQSADEEALSSAGLAGDAVQALPKGERGVFEEREVAYGELKQHSPRRIDIRGLGCNEVPGLRETDVLKDLTL